MSNSQYKLRKNIGADTHVRHIQQNMFQPQATGTLELIPGEITAPQPEPLFTQTKVSLSLAIGGEVTSVPYPNAFIDPLTGNAHGLYEGPIKGQMVLMGFIKGNKAAPIVVNRYPYQGQGDTAKMSAYINPMTKKAYDATDVFIGHFSGSIIRFNSGGMSGKKPGSITIHAVTDLEMESLLTTKITSPLGIELNGNTDFAVKFTAMKTAFDLLKTQINAFMLLYNTHIHPVLGAATLVTVNIGTAVSSDMTSAQAPLVKL